MLAHLGGLTHAAILQDCGKCFSRLPPLRSTAKFIQIRIANCPASSPVCIFTSGQTATIEATFVSVAAFESASVRLSGIVDILKVPFPLSPPDACGKWGLRCPSSSGSQQTLKIEIPIEASYPKTKIGVELQLVTDKDEMLICTAFPVEIK
ncbi:hypothetical protein QQS21_002768 [Conoideocrella luteorostrata]|uniref:Phosphatidylglycerol/phosphatidylinositol transfer protein n=1 Tax=Conoideocrella luteorostrata TaxID=1105319 RepID=A0AAJ0FW68_9HYPO|nr:hypothetical protein QQS21_002768 [Conoideocrella luteorostrata]